MSKAQTTPEPEVVELRPRKRRGEGSTWRESFLWLVAAGILLFTGILKGINLVIVLAYLLVALWVMNLWFARRAVQGLSARRLPRPPVQAGVPTEWPIEIRDDGPAGGTWVLEERVGEASASWLIVRRGSGAVFRPRVRATFPRRGRYTLEPLAARSSYPFGLVGQSTQILPPDELIVLPKPARVDSERLRTWLFRAWVGGDEERRRLRRIVEGEAEIHGLRDYRSGDPPRRVHWKVTARRNRLTVREYEDAAPPRLLVIVDPWLPPRPKAPDRERLERLISLAAGVCRHWRREAGARLALDMAGPKALAIDGPPGPGTTERMLIALALEEGGEGSDVARPLGELSRAALVCPVLVLSSRADSPAVKAAGRLLGRHVAFSHVGKPEAWYALP
jgi:uncharacterized protein (DUF58 family)